MFFIINNELERNILRFKFIHNIMLFNKANVYLYPAYEIFRLKFEKPEMHPLR